MPTNMKRFTIGIDDDTASQLDRLKQAKYYNKSQSKMIQDLIGLGLASMQQKMDSAPGRETANDARAEPER